MDNRSSLEKSHSKSSNFKLTLICFIAALSVSTLWLGVGMINNYLNISIVLLVAGGIMTLLSFALINKFTR